MSVRIKSIVEAGNLSKERIIMKVSAKDDIGDYAMFRSRYKNDNVTTTVSHVLWFSDKPVGAGDLVILYSKTGSNSSKTNANGTTSHFFYWHSSEPLWEGGDYSAVLLEIDGWSSYNPATKE